MFKGDLSCDIELGFCRDLSRVSQVSRQITGRRVHIGMYYIPYLVERRKKHVPL